jgi:SAM-dependent methyltransferase
VFTATHDIYDALYSFRDYAAEAGALRELLARHHPRATRLLDVGCATGLHLATLAEDFEVFGIDVNLGLLDRARQRLPNQRFACADMSEFELGTEFDVITCLYASIAYVQNEERLRRTLRRFVAHLAPGGIVVVQPWYRSVDSCPLMQVRHVDLPHMKIARVSHTQIDSGLATIEIRYLIATAAGIEQRCERHVTGIFDDRTYLDAFATANLHAELIPNAFGRGADVFVATTKT